jgi:DNA-directed RNA polymerase subunit L
MDVNVLKREKNELRVEIKGEGHTLCNLLQNVLLQDKSVEIAGYDIPHPLVPASILYVRMKGDSSPQKALERALERIRVDMQDFADKIESATVAGK